MESQTVQDRQAKRMRLHKIGGKVLIKRVERLQGNPGSVDDSNNVPQQKIPHKRSMVERQRSKARIRLHQNSDGVYIVPIVRPPIPNLVMAEWKMRGTRLCKVLKVQGRRYFVAPVHVSGSGEWVDSKFCKAVDESPNGCKFGLIITYNDGTIAWRYRQWFATANARDTHANELSARYDFAPVQVEKVDLQNA